MNAVQEALGARPLTDHHCHGVVTGDPDAEEFEALLSESGGWPGSGISTFDTPAGVAVRAHCAPLLGLPRHVSAHRYLSRRAELGWREVNERFLRASHTGVFCVDTGYTPEPGTTPSELARAAGPHAVAHEVVRLESVAESVARTGVGAGDYAPAVSGAVHEAVARPGVVAVKSVAAYRTGFRLDPARPSAHEITRAAGPWLASGRRMDDPVLVRHLLWTAVDTGLPLQLHTGFGDFDLRIPDADPGLLTDWLRLTSGTVPVLLLHCWPYHRQAAYLAAVFEQVHLDVGLTLHHAGPARARAVLEEALEITPFRKLLYSSDACGLAEFFFLGAHAFRRGLGELLADRVDRGELSEADALRYAGWAAAGNARRVYGV